MPVSMSKNMSGGYSVRTPNMVHAKSTTKKKAEGQVRLLNAVEHGWKPDPYGADNQKYGPRRRKK